MSQRRRLTFLDTTLRDGEQAPGALFGSLSKVAIAHALANAGLDAIEVGMPVRDKPIEFETVKRIATEINGPTICVLCRCLTGDVDGCFEAIGHNPNARIHLFIGTSDVHMKKFPKSGNTNTERRAWALKTAVKAVKHARTLFKDVEFTPEDTARTNRKFLVEICEAVIEAGATIINIADTVGIWEASDMARTIRMLQKQVCGIDKIKLSVHCHNDLGLATANTLAAIAEGVDQVEVTVNGMGERAGNCSLEQIGANLHTHRRKYKVDFDFDLKQIGPLSHMIASLGGLMIAPDKPIVGSNAYSHASGVHQHGMEKDRRTYESTNPRDFGVDPRGHVVTKLSGKCGVGAVLCDMGYRLEAEQLDQVFAEVITRANHKSVISRSELAAIVANVLGRDIQDRYQLDGYHIYIDENDGIGHGATFDLLVSGEKRNASAGGNGVIEAVYAAIQIAADVKVQVASYFIKADSQGQDALATCSLTLRNAEGKEVSGWFTDACIIKASVLAFLDALNRF